MSRTGSVASRRRTVASLVACGVLAGWPAAVSAQQLGSVALPASRPISTEVAQEFATIGAVQLSIPILRLDGATAGRSGQSASNSQTGSGNITEITQAGQGNRAGVQAMGNNNTAILNQQGTNNSGQATLAGSALRIDLQQTGNGNQADLSLNGPNGGSLTVRQIGDGSTATLSGPAGRDVTVNQIGNGLSADVSQLGAQKSINVLQVRTR